ncbi:RUB1 conjugating enzyme [Besnoitia besnoiti]|uniref:NEDD8 carrier protein n=1 Tax=Besnoitia besnoiti TaxID=94643 RepID=A0A2A9MKZ9_BESBE|nr:RUB1 conjugating enzyme [Besnoitia besnoiti]PFH36112.1 RUB1 conjugating enzyme [Besnoitia besnoiti]
MLKLYGVGRGRPKQATPAPSSSGENRELDAASQEVPAAEPVSGDTGSSGAAGACTLASAPTQERRRFPGEIRLQKELEDLDLPVQCVLTFSSASTGARGSSGSGGAIPAAAHGAGSLLDMQLKISPDDGYWKGGKFLFVISVPPNYPHDPPKVKCVDRIFHPNIDQQGNVCLNILREDWKPVLSISSVMYGLLHLFLEPNPSDPLNQEAAALLRSNPAEFQRQVRLSLHR